MDFFAESTKLKQEVTYEYLEQILGKNYLTNVKNTAFKNDHAFIPIPPSDYRDHEDNPRDHVKGPEQHYWQKENTITCLTTAFANMLWFCDSRDHAGVIYTAHMLCISPDAIALFKKKLLDLSKMLKCTNVQITLEDCLHEKFYYKPIVTCVKGDDNKSDHTIVIYKGLIFDSNF